MKLFGGGSDPQDEAKRQRQEASLQSIAAGGLPLNAQDRLRENAARKNFFTSNFSVNEFLLTKQCGFEPLGQVMGSCVFQIGWNPTAMWGGAGEIGYLSQAHNEARKRAMDRLKQEAQILGADGVVGVRIETNNVEMTGEMIQFRAFGTAIRATGSDAPPKTEPFLSGLSGQDHWTLLQAGYEPTGFVMETCCYYTFGSYQTSYAVSGGWQNIELGDFTAAQYAAREIAMARAAHHAIVQGGSGVVGATVQNHHQVHKGEDNQPPWIIIEFTFSGTVVKHHEKAGQPAIPEFQIQLL